MPGSIEGLHGGCQKILIWQKFYDHETEWNPTRNKERGKGVDALIQKEYGMLVEDGLCNCKLFCNEETLMNP